MGGSRGGSTGRVYRFEAFRLVPGQQLLLHGGRPVPLGSRALELLRLLVERPGELMGKTALIRHAWPDTHVHEGNLKVNIAALRRALHGVGGEGPYIATVPGRGYRFVAPVHVEGSGATAQFAISALPRAPGANQVIGRTSEVARIVELLAERRLVTVVGTAGVGKTTVALAAARQAIAAYPDAPCFVDLASVSDPQFVPAAVAMAIGAGGNLNDLMAGIVEALGARRSLVVLDNCEHVLNAAALVADHLYEHAPSVAVLATSREPLRCRAEAVLRLSPLPCPDSDASINSAEARAFPSVQLFLSRAADAGVPVIAEADMEAISAICRQLDGLPLAIELAAPQLQSRPPRALLALLEDSFEPLSCGPAEAPIRQQTLMATLDWSYRLLSPEEAGTLRFVSLFAGSFTVADAIGMASARGSTPETVMASLESLTAKSLVSAGYADGELRYRLLETTRRYAAARLRRAGEWQAAAAAHACFLLDKFAAAEVEWRWRVREEWNALHGRYLNDLRNAIDWAFGDGADPDLGIRLTAVAIPLWDEISSIGESRLRVRRALRSPGFASCDVSLQMKLTTAHAWSMAFTKRLDPDAEGVWKESLRLADQAGDTDYRLRALWGLASLRSFNGRHRLALADIAQFEAVAEQANDQAAGAAGERLRLITGFYCGEVRDAREKLEQLARRYDNPTRRPRISRFQMDHHVGIRVSLALVSWVCGRPTDAAAHAQAALEAAILMDHPVSEANALAQAVIPVALWTGRFDVGERHLARLVRSVGRQSIATWGPLCRFFGGVLRGPQGLDEMRLALDELTAGNVLIRMPMFRCMLAEVALAQGRVELAAENVVIAAGMARREERWCYPEVMRVMGLVRRRQGRERRADDLLQRAATLAAASGAVAFERRALRNLEQPGA
ncbi:MAG: winged helix-turn-helix domain-containing protein [Rhodospirillales bacterium]|nr:winged helix-turn-helix domain-containing protein [Rhodospirillales bacterium]